MQADLFQVVSKYNEEGCDLMWAGDFNNHLASSLGLKGNPGEMSQGGKSLVEFIQEEELVLLNTRALQQ